MGPARAFGFSSAALLRAAESIGKIPESLILVRGRGLEPPSPYGHHHLKMARLPISPPARVYNFIPVVPNNFSILERFRDKQITFLNSTPRYQFSGGFFSSKNF